MKVNSFLLSKGQLVQFLQIKLIVTLICEIRSTSVHVIQYLRSQNDKFCVLKISIAYTLLLIFCLHVTELNLAKIDVEIS